MALSTATITGDISDQIGNDFDARRTKIWLTTNVPGQTIIDTTGDKIRLGSGNVTLNADGTFSIVVWVPGTGSNPASWQTSIHVDYPDRNAPGGRATKTFGPFTITANANLADLVAQMPVQPEYAMQFLDRIDGVLDLGNKSGAVTIDPAIALQGFDATGPTVLTLGPPPGNSVSIKVVSGASNVTITGMPDVELTDGSWATFVYWREAWELVSAGGSGEPAIPDSTPPTAVTDLAATGGSEQLTATWSAATDSESTVKYGCKVWRVGDTEPSSYTVQTSVGLTATGLIAGTYNVKVYSFSNGGNTTPDTATATVTAPPATLTETFTHADGTTMLGQPTTTGGYTWGTDSTGTTLIGSSSSTGVTTGNKYAGPSSQSIAVNLGQSAAVLTMDFDVTAAGNSSVAAAIAGTNNNNTLTAIVDRGYNETRLFYDGAGAPETAVSSPPTTGTLEVRYDGTTVTVKMNGATIITRTRAATGTKVAIAVANGGKIDNLTVDPL